MNKVPIHSSSPFPPSVFLPLHSFPSFHLPTSSLEDTDKVPDLHKRVIQRSRSHTNNIRFPLIDHDASIIQLSHDTIEHSRFQADAELRTPFGGIGRCDDSVGIGDSVGRFQKEFFEKAGHGDGLLADVEHTCAVEDLEGGEESGQGKGGRVAELVACCTVDRNEAWRLEMSMNPSDCSIVLKME